MQGYADKYNYRIDLAYASDRNLLFGERIYRKDAQLFLYNDLAEIVFMAADYCFKTHGMRFILYDGLRTIDAQEKMMKTKRARDNPHWMEPPRFLSPPGSGAHPRGMAIDIGMETLDGVLIDMGTAFDSMTDEAHRNYNHSKDVQKNIAILDDSMVKSAESLNIPLSLLTEEHWDYRLPSTFYNQYAPLYDSDLPEHMQQLTHI